MAALGSTTGRCYRDYEIEILAHPVELGVDFCQTRAALEHQAGVSLRCKIGQENGAEVVFFDQALRETGLCRSETDSFLEKDGVFMNARRDPITVLRFG